jgi:hypothetical protein
VDGGFHILGRRHPVTTPIIATALNDLGPLHRAAVGFLARSSRGSK